MLKLSIKYSLFCSFFLIALFFLSWTLAVNPLIDLRQLVFDILIFGLFIFFAGKEYKVYKNGGYFHFWEGMSIGFLVYALATVVFGFVLVIYFMMKEEAVSQYQQAATAFILERADLYKEEFGEAGLNAQLNEIKEVTVFDLVLSTIFKKILAGFFVTPVISIILRKQPK